MATINLGRIKPVFRGAYNNSTSYVVDDIVTFGNETFIAIQAGSGNATSNASYWTKLAAKGTDGTDVGATLTTQGDILYRDGSGLQRLAKGTAGQVLKMNAAANAPEYGTLSSDYVKVSTTNISNGVGTINIDNVFTSDYNTYKVFMTSIKGHDSTNGNAQMRFRNGNSDASGSYWVAGKGSYRTSSANNNATDGQWGGNAIQFGGWNTPDTDTESGNAIYDYDITIFGINGSNYKQLLYKKFGWEQGNTYAIFATGGALLNNTGTVNGISLFRTNGGGFRSDGKIIIYGLKH